MTVDEHVYRVPPERVRGTSTALAIILAILVTIGLLVVVLIFTVLGASASQRALLPALVGLVIVTVALGVGAFVLRRQLRDIYIRTGPDGIAYVAAAIVIETTWSNCERIGIVPIGLGFGEGIVLREPALRRARFPSIVRSQRLDRVIPLSSVAWWWRDTELAADLERWAPQLGVVAQR